MSTHFLFCLVGQDFAKEEMKVAKNGIEARTIFARVACMVSMGRGGHHKLLVDVSGIELQTKGSSLHRSQHYCPAQQSAFCCLAVA
jgi:hypothetical protein